MKRRPVARQAASPWAVASMLATSSFLMSSRLSSRKVFVKLSVMVVLVSGAVEVGDDAGAVEVEAEAHRPEAALAEDLVHATAISGAHVEHEEAAAARAHELPADGAG